MSLQVQSFLLFLSNIVAECNLVFKISAFNFNLKRRYIHYLWSLTIHSPGRLVALIASFPSQRNWDVGERREGVGGEMLHLSQHGVKAQVAYYLDLVGEEHTQFPHHMKAICRIRHMKSVYSQRKRHRCL